MICVCPIKKEICLCASLFIMDFFALSPAWDLFFILLLIGKVVYISLDFWCCSVLLLT